MDVYVYMYVYICIWLGSVYIYIYIWNTNYREPTQMLVWELEVCSGLVHQPEEQALWSMEPGKIRWLLALEVLDSIGHLEAYACDVQVPERGGNSP